MMCKINLKILKHLGLSLDTRKRYVIHYDCHTWCVMGIYDNLEEAVQEGLNQTLDEYHESVEKYGKEKGFATELSVWNVLVQLEDAVRLSSHPESEEEWIRGCIQQMKR